MNEQIELLRDIKKLAVAAVIMAALSAWLEWMAALKVMGFY